MLLLTVLGLVILGTTGGIVAMGWKRAKNAERYLPLLNAAETRHGIPHDLLARLAYQESHFRDDIVSGAYPSAQGALGIMQIVPAFHPTAQPLNVPAAIEYAAQFLTSLHKQLGTWRLAVAAYNAGAGNVKKYGGLPPFPETQRYVAQIFADVPGVA
jgi:soluble lytic murein transglycosylase-like protein